MSRDTGSRIDNSARNKQQYQRLPNSSLWVQTAESSVQMVRERYGLRGSSEPIYIANSNEQVVLADLVKQGVPVVLAGPPGIGKKALVRSVFYRLNVPLQTFVASTGTSLQQLFGRQGIAGAQGELTAWNDGPLSLAARAANGGCVNGFYLDELLKLPGEFTSYLCNLIDGGRTLPLPTGEEMDIKGNLKLVLSYHPTAGSRLDDALRSRVVAIRIGYPASEVEVSVLRDNRIGGLERYARGNDLATGFVKFANIIRRAHGYEVDLDFPPLSEKETKLLRMLAAPPSSTLLVAAARMISNSNYGSIEAAQNFILPSLLQDIMDVDLPQLSHLLSQMIEALVPRVEGTRQKLTFKDVDTLFEEEHAMMMQEEEESPAEPRQPREWSRTH